MTELNKNYIPNFQTRTGKFIKGYYTFEGGIGYRFICKDTFKNINRINNSNFVLELFNELPDKFTINQPN